LILFLDSLPDAADIAAIFRLCCRDAILCHYLSLFMMLQRHAIFAYFVGARHVSYIKMFAASLFSPLRMLLFRYYTPPPPCSFSLPLIFFAAYADIFAIAFAA